MDETSLTLTEIERQELLQVVVQTVYSEAYSAADWDNLDLTILFDVLTRLENSRPQGLTPDH